MEAPWGYPNRNLEKLPGNASMSGVAVPTRQFRLALSSRRLANQTLIIF